MGEHSRPVCVLPGCGVVEEAVQAVVVVPVDVAMVSVSTAARVRSGPVRNGESFGDGFVFEQADHRLGGGVVVGVTDAADRTPRSLAAVRVSVNAIDVYWLRRRSDE